MIIMRRPVRQRCHEVPGHTMGGMYRSGGVAVLLAQPAGPVGPVGTTDHPYVGMDPSDPATYIREYNPQPGMISWLNYDGAMPNNTQTGPNRQVVPR